MKEVDFQRWKKIISEPTWYREVLKDIGESKELKKEDPSVYEEQKGKVLGFFEDHLARGDVALASSGKDFDSKRKPIDTIVIHHTSGEPGLTAERLSAMELLLLYAPQFDDPKYEVDKEIDGQAIYSGHFRMGSQVFWPYHWIIRNDGTAERLLNDDEVGWHSGNWDVNCRSIAIVLDGDYSDKRPSDVELGAIAKVIKKNYPEMSKENIIGHREVIETICPSNLFLGPDGWKKDLSKLL